MGKHLTLKIWVGIWTLVLGGCIFDGFGGGIIVTPDVKDDEPYIRALMDSNGLQSVVLYTVIKLKDPADRNQEYALDFGNMGIPDFRFIPAVAKIKAIKTINLGHNGIKKIPSGIGFKNWGDIGFVGNNLCNLSPEDTLTLDLAHAYWKGFQICLRP